MGRGPPHRKEMTPMNTLWYINTIFGLRSVYYLRKSNVYFISLPDGTLIQVYPIG